MNIEKRLSPSQEVVALLGQLVSILTLLNIDQPTSCSVCLSTGASSRYYSFLQPNGFVCNECLADSKLKPAQNS